MGHVQRAWGQISWEDHVPYTMDTSSGLPIESSQTSFGSFQFTQDELVRHAASAHLAFTMPRTKFCRGGCVHRFYPCNVTELARSFDIPFVCCSLVTGAITGTVSSAKETLSWLRVTLSRFAKLDTVAAIFCFYQQ